MRPRQSAATRVLALFVVAQLASFIVVQRGCSEYYQGELWAHGAAGPLAALKAIPRFRYHSVVSNLGFVLLVALLLAAPAAHVIWPRRATLFVSAAALVVWILFGMGMSIDHM